MNVFANASIGKKLILLLVIFLIGYGFFGFISFSTLNTLSIHGNLYNRIIMNKDLIADILPPPGYIIESYLNVYEMIYKTEPAEIDYHITELKKLREEYDASHNHWVNEPLFEEGELKDAMVKGAYEPAIQFYDIVFNRFIPAIQRDDREYAREILHGDLKTQYEIHRRSIDQVVLGATENYLKVEDTATAAVQSETRKLLIIAFFVIVVAALIIYLIGNSIRKPIVNVVNTLKDIAEGEGDLTRTIPVNSKDEIGSLALYFNKTLEKIKNLVIIIKDEASVLSEIGDDLSSNMTETAAAINQITANIQSIKGRVLNQSASVTQTNATMEQVVTNINKLNVHVESQSSNVSQASSAIEEMVANINSITETLIKNTDNVNVLKKIAASISKIKESTENVLTKFEAIDSSVKTVAQQGENIRAAMEEQGEGSKQILEGIGNVNEITRHVKTSSEEMHEGSKEVIQESTNLEKATQEITAGMNEMASGAQEINVAVNHVNEISSKNRIGIEKLMREVSRFKVA